jgi:hypothetical protein
VGSLSPVRATRRLIVVLALSVLVSVCAEVAVDSSPAGAVDVAASRGDPGGAALYPAEIGPYWPFLHAGSGTILESPRYSHRPQWICRRVRYFKLNVVVGRPDTWERVYQRTRCARIAADQIGVGFGNDDQYFTESGVKYRAVVRIRWRIRPGLPVVGALRFEYNRPRDYACPTPITPHCEVGYNNELDSAYITWAAM